VIREAAARRVASVRRAHLTVAAGCGVVRVLATIDGIAGVVRAEVRIVAIRRRPGLAGPAVARVVRRAGVSVVAGLGVVGMRAAACGIARIIGARVPVVARNGIDVDATVVGIARVVGAGIGVVAAQHRPADANAIAACVARRAGVSVVAGTCDVDVVTPRREVTDIRRTVVPVVAEGAPAIVDGVVAVVVDAVAGFQRPRVDRGICVVAVAFADAVPIAVVVDR
jgi:hypothetical protein